MDIDPYWSGEAQLMGYGESDSAGAWIKLQVTTEDLAAFRGLKGTSFDVLLANPDQPVGKVEDDKPKGGPKSKAAALLCKDPDFQRYCYARSQNISLEPGAVNYAWNTEADREANAKSLMCYWCHIQSRAELDHDEKAWDYYQAMTLDFHKWMEARDETRLSHPET